MLVAFGILREIQDRGEAQDREEAADSHSLDRAGWPLHEHQLLQYSRKHFHNLAAVGLWHC